MSHRSSVTTSLIASAGALVLATSSVSAQLKVALCAAESSNTHCTFVDAQARLMATNLFSQVDIINVLTAIPTLQQLLQYNAVMCWTNSTPANNNAWGDVLADYVDAGGGVVVTVFANSTTTTGRNIGGRWQNGYMVIIDRSGNFTGANGSLGTVHQPSHPLMARVTGFTGGPLGPRPTGTALQAGATLIAEWDNAKVLVAVGANPQRVDLGFYPGNATTCTASPGWATGGDQLMANALLYVSTAAAYGSFGAGCAGTMGAPTLAPALGSRPILGTTFTANLGSLPQSLAVMATGFSNTRFGPVTLPFDLTPLGMPGCSLLTSVVLTQVATGTGNAATWSISVPNDSSILGASFFNQAFVPSPSTNPAGLVVTNGGRGRLGGY
jgi:hypothetical protein